MSAVPRPARAPAIRPQQQPRPRRRSWPRALAGMCLVALFVGSPMMPASRGGILPGPAPTGLTAIAGDAQVTLSWSPPPVPKGATVDGYDIYEGTSPGRESGSPVGSAAATSISYTVTRLSDGKTYYFKVAAVWSASGVSLGQGPSSGEASATTLPAPTGLTAIAGDTRVTLSWSPPAPKGATVDGYDIYQGTTPGGESGSPVNASPVQGISYMVTGLSDGTTYYFTVAAVYGAGQHGPSSGEASATPVAATRLGAPTGLTATVGDTRVTLSWSPPAPKGATVDGYDIYQGTTPGGESGSPVNASLVQGTSYTVTGLTDGTTYYFTVAAVTGAGQHGPSSGEASATPVAATRLGAPTGLTATAGDTRVTLSWSPPPGGGPPVAGYRIFRGTSRGGESGSPVNASLVQGTSYTVTGLTDGTTYYFTVTAVTGAGGRGPHLGRHRPHHEGRCPRPLRQGGSSDTPYHHLRGRCSRCQRCWSRWRSARSWLCWWASRPNCSTRPMRKTRPGSAGRSRG